MTPVHVVVPHGIDDPGQPSGGNTYDRQVCHGLGPLGWLVDEHAVPGDWPQRDPSSLTALADALRQLPDGAVVLLDGLIASAAPEVLVPEASRLRCVVLVHMPLGHRPGGAAAQEIRAREARVLWAVRAVITTSAWTRRRLGELYALPAERIRVALPGVAVARVVSGTPAGDALLCVAALTAGKGHDVLLDALASISELSWRCACVGSLDRDTGFVRALRRRLNESGLDRRVGFLGPQTGAELDRRYAAADVVVLPSRAETYGMVVTEALAHGLPVIATDVGGVTEALGHGADGNRPGLLVAPEDPPALGAALRAWLCDPELRERLRRRARERRASLPGWPTTASRVAEALAEAAR